MICLAANNSTKGDERIKFATFSEFLECQWNFKSARNCCDDDIFLGYTKG
jgi:hypothetical protein